MKCPKCKTGTMVAENDFTGREISKRCFICGERTWSDFTVRPPLVRDSEAVPPHTAKPRQGAFTPEECAHIVAQRAVGVPCNDLAAAMGCNVTTIWKVVSRAKQKGGQPCLEPL